MSLELLEKARISNSNLALRKRFIGLGPREIATLASLAPWASRVAAPLASEFYAHQFEFPGTRAFFADFAARKGIPIEALKETLESAQADYFRGIFDEAATAGDFGPEYFAQRMHVGAVHNRIDLPMKWYIGSYTHYHELACKYLARSYWHRPGFRRRAEAAILRAFNYDQQAVLDSFFLEVLSSLGFNTASVNLDSEEKDVSDNLREFKTVARSALEGLTRASVDLGLTGGEIATAATQVSDSVQRQASSLEQTSATISMISQNIRETAASARHANELATGGGAHGVSVVDAMEKISAASRQIASVTNVITELAFQTNVLALNAAVEAARAGNLGLGFAVVASEVRNLAQRSATAAKEITSLIDDAVRKVNEGAAAVATMTESIEKISASANQQADAVRQVSLGVQQLDASMQTNAAQAEELTATAHRIAEQARELSHLAAHFEVGRSPSSSQERGRLPRAARGVGRARTIGRSAPTQHDDGGFQDASDYLDA